MQNGKLAVVSGASTGIGQGTGAAGGEGGYDLVIAADEPMIENAAAELRTLGVDVDAVEADLATTEGVDRLLDATRDRPVDLLFANAGRGLGKAFAGQDFSEVRRVVDTNVTGTLYLVQRSARRMIEVGNGRIHFTGSIAGFIPGTFQAVYNVSKSLIDSFAIGLRHELKDTGVSVTLLMPGPTETEFFERADLMDTQIGRAEKDDPAEVARIGFDALMAGDEQVVSGWKNKLQVAAAHVTPAGGLAEQHRKTTEPGSTSCD